MAKVTYFMKDVYGYGPGYSTFRIHDSLAEDIEKENIEFIDILRDGVKEKRYKIVPMESYNVMAAN